MKKIMLVVACVVMVGGFMVGCKKETTADKAAATINQATDDAKKAAATVEKDVKKEAEALKK